MFAVSVFVPVTAETIKSHEIVLRVDLMFETREMWFAA